MEKFTESPHCESRVHCRACRGDSNFRDSIMGSFEWDGECPFGVTAETVGVQPKPPRTPPLWKQGLSFTQAMLKVAKNYAQGKEIRASEELIKERSAICETNVCGKYDGNKMRCLECGCPFHRKLIIASQECPLGYWGAVGELKPKE